MASAYGICYTQSGSVKKYERDQLGSIPMYITGYTVGYPSTAYYPDAFHGGGNFYCFAYPGPLNNWPMHPGFTEGTGEYIYNVSFNGKDSNSAYNKIYNLMSYTPPDGFEIDENGDQYFCVKSGTTATINYNLFSNDAKKTGKEFKVVFKTTNIKNRDTTFISCIDNNIGLDMKVESANIYSSNGSLYSPYCEEDIIEFEFNINKDTDIPMVLTYEDGVGNRPMIYTSDASFMQVNANPITIGSEDCDVYIYRMKAYSTSLTDRGILSNFIADARNADEMISRYNRNQIYDENGLLTPETFAEKCPDLRVIMVDAPWFTNDKKNKVDDTNITMIYKNGDVNYISISI